MCACEMMFIFQVENLSLINSEEIKPPRTLNNVKLVYQLPEF